MAGRRGNAPDLRPLCSMFNQPGTRLLVTLAVLFLISSECRADYMMGGHLDNNESKGIFAMEHRSDEEASPIPDRTSSLDEEDRDFDLVLDLLGDETAMDRNKSSSSDTRTTPITSTTIDEDQEPEIAARYRVLPYAFNGGQPFSLEKDPVTGQIDFEKAPPLKALEYDVKNPVQREDPTADTGSQEDEMNDGNGSRDDPTALGPNEINPYSPSFHDFLNLPVRYSYEKYENPEKYPLISSSYANTKVQSGATSYNTYNHKKYHEAIKEGVDVQTLYVHPSKKTYHQTITRTTSRPSTTSTTPSSTTTTERLTTVASTVTTSTARTTTTVAPTSGATTKRTFDTRYPTVTTWKPKQKPSQNIYGIYGDYEATLPIERLQQSNGEQQTSTEKSRYVPPPPRPKPQNASPDTSENERTPEYEEGYDEDYDRILQIAGQSSSQENDENDSQEEYSYGPMDIPADSRRNATKLETSPSTSTTTMRTSTASTTSATTTDLPMTVSRDENRTEMSTTSARPMEEKRITSMPIDGIGFSDDYRVTSTNYNGVSLGTSENAIPGVTNTLYQHNRPSIGENYYPRQPPISGGNIFVKSTSNVVVPPGQDTVSFVLGNRQSVGSVSDADFYGIRGPSGNYNEMRPPNVAFGKIGTSRPSVSSQSDHYSGQMIVSAGIGVGNSPIGSYHQRPSNAQSFDHAVVTVGMPTVDVASPGDNGGTTINSNGKNPDSSTNSLETPVGQKWWTNSQQSDAPQDPTSQQFGYRVVFPDEKTQKVPDGAVTSDNTSGVARPIEEHVIVVHESELGSGNTIRLDLSSNPTPGYHPDTSTTQRLPVNSADKPLPEPSESLTPPAEQRPNVLPSGVQRPPSYNYYHHHHSPGNTRPNDFQRLPQRLPSPQQSPLPPSNNGFKRRPAPLSIESNLPNILPQFRPNAKTSHGHNRGETIGTIPAGAVPPYAATRIRRPPAHLHHHARPPTSRRPLGPPHLQRLNPPPLPPPPPINALRLPTPASLVASPNLGLTGNNQQDAAIQSTENAVIRLVGAANSALHKVSVGAPPPRLALDERHRQTSNEPYAAGQTIKSRLEDDTLERFTAEPPLRPPYFTKRTTGAENEGIPRIATLQMIQHVGSRDDETSRPNLPPPFRFDDEKIATHHENAHDLDETGHEMVTGEEALSANRRGDEDRDDPKRGNEGERADYIDNLDSPVYIVYPVKSALDIRPANNDDPDQDDGSVVLGTYGSQRPLPPDTLLQDSEEEEVNAAVENPYVSSTSIIGPSYVDSPRPQLASNFPYPLEKPDPSMFTSQLREKPLLVPSEHRKNTDRTKTEESEDIAGHESDSDLEADVVRDIERDASVNVIPYLQDHSPFTLKENAGVISATLHRIGSSGSAATSTPIAYVYTPTTRAPVRRHEDPYAQANFERAGPVLLPSQQPSSSSSSAPSPQSFMAPFVASASAEAPTKNGWSVVVPAQQSNEETTNQRRHDSPENEAKKSNAEHEATADSDDESTSSVKDTTKSTETTRYDGTASQTEKNEFDVENFTPQLFGGFKPIFEFPSDGENDPDANGKLDKDNGSIAERPRSETG